MKYWVLDKIFNKPSKQRHMEYLAVDENFTILDTSEGVQRFADSSTEVRLGEDVRDNFPELIGLEESLRDILQGNQEFFELKRIARFSDNNKALYLDLYIIEDEDETTFGKRLIIFLEDVTESLLRESILVQTSNEASLLVSDLGAYKDYIDKIFASIPDALLVTTRSGYIKTVNRAAQELFGYSEGELIGQPISMFLSNEEPENISETLYFLIQNKVLKNIQLAAKTKTGQRIFIAFSCSVMQTESDEYPYFVYLGREIKNPEVKQNNSMLTITNFQNYNG